MDILYRTPESSSRANRECIIIILEQDGRDGPASVGEITSVAMSEGGMHRHSLPDLSERRSSRVPEPGHPASYVPALVLFPSSMFSHTVPAFRLQSGWRIINSPSSSNAYTISKVYTNGQCM
jgi:hypothetical protein